MAKKKDLDKIGFLDIELRDEFNIPIFKSKRKRAGRGIEDFENFCKDKLGITPFSADEFEKKIKKKYKLEGMGFKL